MTKDLLIRYGQLKQTISKAEEELELIKDQALKDFLTLRGDDEHLALQELPGCTFILMKRKTWTYPDHVKVAEKMLKEEKTHAEQTGTATFVEKESLVFKTSKD